MLLSVGAPPSTPWMAVVSSRRGAGLGRGERERTEPATTLATPSAVDAQQQIRGGLVSRREAVLFERLRGDPAEVGHAYRLELQARLELGLIEVEIDRVAFVAVHPVRDARFDGH